MNASTVSARRRQELETEVAGAFGAASLRRISWRAFLPSVARYASKSAVAKVRTGQTSSCSRWTCQPSAAARRRNAGLERVEGGVVVRAGGGGR